MKNMKKEQEIKTWSEKAVKNSWLILTIIIIGVIIFGYLLYQKPNSKRLAESQCQVKELTYYYSPQCSWCQKIEEDETIKMIKQLGIKITKVNISIGPIRHQFSGVPTFVIDEKVYSGYKTFEELKELLGCTEEENQSLSEESLSEIEFIGENGEEVSLIDEQLKLDVKIFNDNLAYYYHTKLSNGKIIYFFVVKDKAGVYRAAANACQVCFDARMGFRQEGDFMVCNTCGNKYPLEKIATEKGGCNPGPINPDLEVGDGKIFIKQSDLEQVSNFF